MTEAAIISIGTEIMRGKIDDTNSTFLSRYLSRAGITVSWRLSVEDDVKKIHTALDVCKSCDLIILTGGLGPTDDDCTREALASYHGKKLEFSEEIWKSILNFFESHIKGRKVAESNKKQAMIFQGAEPIYNDVGTAPGLFYYDDDKMYLLLPGPPRENQAMVKKALMPKLISHKFVDGVILTNVIRVYNVGESTIADLLEQLNLESQIGYYFTRNGWIEIHVTIFDENDRNTLEGDTERIKALLHAKEIVMTEHQDLSTLVFEELKQKKATISFAESITGGSIAAEFVKNPGASEFFPGSIVSYSNDMKCKVLGVSQQTLKDHGAVSAETVEEMAYGLRKVSGADICVAVSGIAGPTGGSKEKPVGLVYFGFLCHEKMFVKKEVFLGTRERIIKRAVNYAYLEILDYCRNSSPGVWIPVNL